MKENTDEMISNMAITDVNSSIRLVSFAFERCSAVIINKQKPSKLAEVPKMCCDVLFAI
jgi:frataxin-like iron-binding protein CyaY